MRSPFLASVLLPAATQVGLLTFVGCACVNSNAQAVPNWQPKQSAGKSEDYAGTKACESCHRSEFARQPKSQMGRSMLRPTERNPDHPQLSMKRGDFTYTVLLNAHSTLTVEDGNNKITEPIMVAVGAGEHFQSYLVRHNGAPYRVAVDYIAKEHGLGLDNEADAATSLEGALGRRHSENYVRNCFGCHSPASVAGENIDLVSRPFGNTCEVCHGPGARHVNSERQGQKPQPAIFNPAHLSAKDESEFCGQCHTTASAVKEQKLHGVATVISEPYRLESSRCWNPTDQRIRCTACHDPHKPIVRNAPAYDHNCLACHSSNVKDQAPRDSVSVCSVAKRNCVTCHMPQASTPDTPIVYFDHRIRVVKAEAPFPD